MLNKRKDARFPKEYNVTFATKENDKKIYNAYKLLDISKGGLKFFSYDYFSVGTGIIFYIKFPFLYPQVTEIEGQVVGIQEVMKGKTYKISAHFINIPSAAILALHQMDEINLKNK